MRRRIVSCLTMAALSGAAVAASGSGSAPAEPQPSTQLRLVPADELIGHTVLTREGERVGSLEYVTLNLDEGNVSHLVVNTSGGEFGPASRSDQPTGTSQSAAEGTAQSAAEQNDPPGAAPSGQDLIVVPWNVAEISRDTEVLTVAAAGHHIAHAPRLAREELNRLAEPSLATYVVNYWAPASELAAMEGERGQRSADQRDREPSQRQPQSGTGAAASRSAGSEAQTREQLQRGTPGRTRNQQGSSGATALFGQEVVASVAPPLFQLGQDLEGAQVTDRDGQPIGQVRRIMIDADTGDAAFAIVEGSSVGSAALPLQTLEWSAEGTTMLMADPSALQADAALTEPSGQVNRQQLAQLYARFGVEPYWQRSGRSATGSTQDPTTELPR